ncbi:MAG: hypothetical protein H6667_26030 [Ardenticatenaceae bacterium]|nr:hypothetical protein [Ardenticatenaceae bacterium]
MAEKTEDRNIIARTIAFWRPLAHPHSWRQLSNGYNWLACETGADISGDTEACWSWFFWGLRPTDFINFTKATGTGAMYTRIANGRPRKRRHWSLFSMQCDDDRGIGIDVRGRDWGR